MFGSEILDTAIGLVFVYLVASLLATSVREAIEGILKTRAIHLERGIRQLLDDPDGTKVTKELFDHPLIYALFAGSYEPEEQLKNFILNIRRGAEAGETPQRLGFLTNLPSYIPSRNFALALMHLVSGTGSDGNGVLSMEALKANAAALPEGRLRKALLVAVGEAQGDMDRARTSIEAWYDGTMDRISGWYKRETQYILFGVGLAVAVAVNVDTLHIVKTLLTNNTIREKLIGEVTDKFGTFDPATSSAAGKSQAEVGDLSGIIGYAALAKQVEAALDSERKRLEQTVKTNPALADDAARAAFVEANASTGFWLWWLRLKIWFAALSPASVAGWLASALAISLGAPFWFDTLNKLMVIRSTVKPYEKSAPEGSADRGATAPVADPLSPRPTGGAPAGQAAAQPAQAAIAAPDEARVANLRVALDGADPETLSFQHNGNQIPVPPDGFLELPLEVEADHHLSAQGRRGAQAVTWNMSLRPTLDDEAKPIAASLA